MIQRGSCLCGRVRYEIRGELTHVLNCHCSDCRKAHGAAFRTRATVNTEDLTWLSGEELLTSFQAKPGELRMFCRVCGSSILTKCSDNPDEYGLALGTLDTDPAVKPECHVWVSDKASWHDITDRLPQFPEGAGEGD